MLHMDVTLPCSPSPLHAPRAHRLDPLLRAPWNVLDDAALLSHFRSDRGVRFEPVIDACEIRPERIAGILAGRFEFNGQTHALPDPIDWLTNPSHDVEWHILLHKFYYAVGLAQAWQRDGDALAVQRWTQLIDGWMQQTPAGFIAADVTGRRVQNWIYSLHALLLDTTTPAPIDAAFLRRLLRSIHEQVEFLCAHLTPKRNHRTLELLAIFLAGVVFPEFERAAAWRELALRETLVNVRADLLPDGVHCELSTDYHHLALRNWLQVRRLAADNGYGLPREFDQALEAGLDFSMHVHQPSGAVPSFSDGDVRGFLPLLAQGAALFGRSDMKYVATGGREGTPPQHRVAHFPSSGYHVLRSDWASADAQHLVWDCGPLGEGNHGHFDALSFELAANGRALIVDPGRYTYSEALDEGCNWRLHFRSTAAHNTVGVDGLNQTRYLPKPIKEPSRHGQGAVRHKISGPAPETELIEAFSGAQLDLLHGRCASHEYDAVHERCIVFVDRRYWIVSDWLRAELEHDYVLNFQLGAQAQGHARLHIEATFTLLHSPGLAMAQPQRSGQSASLDGAWVSHSYGHKQAAPALRTRTRARHADFDTVLLPSSGQTPHLRVADLPVQGSHGAAAQALRIEAAGLVDGWLHARGEQAQWRIGDWQFSGRWLHWRTTPDGALLRAISHAGASLQTPAGAWRLETP
jgi:Heparinase II/III N-terminus/Heparinase II/III-like protein